MNKLTSLLRRAPKRTSALVAMIAAAIIVPATMFAWGPERPTYTIANPADHVTFNSITDNPNYGDERNFVTIKDAANTNAGGWVDDINVQNGKEYYVRMYVHNNAADNLGLVAQNVTSKFNVPTQTAKRVQIDGYLSSSNASPTQIWDQAVFSGATDFNLSYVAGSATYTNNVFTGGTSLPDSVVGSGATLGYAYMDGKIPGCFQYTGYVIFKVKATTSEFTVQKSVRVNGATDTSFKESVSVKPGDKVDYQIYFKNTGGTQLKDVVVKDVLPKGMTYVPGTTWLHNSGGTKQVADGITAGGIVIGGYLGGGDAYIKFTAQVAGNDDLAECGVNSLRNVAKVTTTAGTKEDTADVTVTKVCDTKPVYKCNSLTVSKIERTKFKFDVNYTVENATFKNITYIVRDANGKEIFRTVNTASSLTYTQTTVGKYSVQAIVTVTVGGQDKTASGDCKANFEVLKTQEFCTIPGKETLPVDSPECATTPPELPQTGIGGQIVSFLGLGSLVASAGYYVSSRRNLIGALLNR